MHTTDTDRVVELLAEPECRALIGTVRIGRLAFTRDALPAIQPVAFHVHDGRVVIPVRTGSSLLPGTRGTVVAFEVDRFDEHAGTGWTVTVVGPSRSVTDRDEVAVLDRLPWTTPGRRPDRRYVTVGMALVQGWRAVPARDAAASPTAVLPAVADPA
ncbi:pyridoxamine 5'-phosphate oxidase family protein [Geodermatophilus sp. SYSU D00697]